MKVVIIILGTVVLLFGAAQLLFMKGQRNIEMYPYDLVKAYDDFEIRNYEASLFTSVDLGTEGYEQSSGRGFSILAGYIFGDNDRNEKIAMTSPVAMTLGDTVSMMFMVPKEHEKENLPKPNQSRIEFKEVPAKTVAAIRFGAWANDDKIKRYKQKLINALEEQNVDYTERFYYLGYNAPYEFFNRRNEIIVELAAAKQNP